MNSCPNHNDSAYKLLEKYLGKKGVYALFMSNNESLPTLEMAQQIVDIHLKTQEKKVDNEVDKIVSELEDTVKKSTIVKNVDEYFSVISNHLRNLRERKSYERLKKIFTTEEGINKLSTLQDILAQAVKAEEDMVGDKRKLRAVAQTIVQINYLTDLMLEDVKEIVKNTDDSIENLHILQSYLNTLNDWNILLDTENISLGNTETTKLIGETKQKITQIENFIAKNDESGVVKTLQELLIPASKEITNKISKEIDVLESKLQNQIKRKADAKTLATTQKDIKSLKDRLQEYDFENKQNVIDFLKGKKGDASAINSWMESFRDSTDPTISAFSTFVSNQLNDVAQKVATIDKEYRNALAPLITESERLQPDKLGEKITFKDVIYQDSEKTEVYTLLNEWKDYRYNLGQLSSDEAEKKQIFIKSNTEEDKEAYLEAKKERQKFEQDVMFTEFKPEVYEKYKIFDDELGQELKQEVDTIWDKINIVDEHYKLYGQELTEDQELEKEGYLLEYKMLGNLNQPDGSPKTGKELEKAKKMQEYKTLNRKFYEWKDNATMFEKAKERHSEYLLSTKNLTSDSQEYLDEMEKWEDKNTRTVITEAFYKKRDLIVKEISILTKRFKNKDLQDSIKTLYDEIQSITYGYRDEDGQPIGTLIQEKGAERIKLAQEKIQDLQSRITKVSGLNREEQSRMSELFTKAQNGSISLSERGELDDLVAKSKAEGLSESQKKRLFQLFEQLKDLQSSVPTEYYIQVFNNLSTKYGAVLQDDGTINGKFYLDSPKFQDLLQKQDFKDWFELNHIESEKFNSDTKQIEKIWKRTYQWNKTVPNNPEDIEVKPSLKYSYREIRPEYKTERVIGVTIDNKGNWLPNPDKVGSEVFKNEKYFNLINSNNPEDERLSKILDINKKYLLSTQEGLNRNGRLYLDVPRVEKETSEENLTFASKVLENPKDLPKVLWERIKEGYRNVTNYDTADVRYESPFEGKYEKDYVKIPIKYVGKMNINEVSLNLQRSIIKYTHTSELNKQLAESLPVARALNRVLDRTDLHKTTKNKNSVRNSAIRKILIKDYEGQKSNLELKGLQGFEKPALFLINIAKNLASWTSVKINVPAAVANVVQGEFQNLINSGNFLFSQTSYAIGKQIFATRFIPAVTKDYGENVVNKESLESQILTRFEPIQGESITEALGNKFSQSKIFDLIGIKPFFSLREWGEIYMQSSSLISAMYETKVDYGQDVISLLDAYELDANGIIKLKDGIDKSWDFTGANFKLFKAKVQKLNRDIHGNYATFDKTQLEMYALGSLAMFLKRFFFSTTANLFGAGGTWGDYFTLKGTDRFNLVTGGNRGHLYHSLQIIHRELKTGLKDYDSLSQREKQDLLKSTKWIGTILSAYLLMALLGYSGDDRNKKKNLSKMPWWKLHLLYQIDRLYIETSQPVSLKSYFDYTLDLQIKTSLEKWFKLVSDIISQDEYQTTVKNAKGDIIHKEGDKKWKTQALRATGLNQLLLTKDSPDELLKNYDKIIRGR